MFWKLLERIFLPDKIGREEGEEEENRETEKERRR